MANIKSHPHLTMPNLLHILEPIVDRDKHIINTIIEINSGSLNKYELITETGHLKLDRVSYSSMSYPFSYGCIPQTYDHDNDPLDIEIVGITEPLIPGCVAEVRVIGIMKFEDSGEIDDKVIGVLAADKRVDHIKTIEDLGPHFQTETSHFWEYYKHLKKPGTAHIKGFFSIKEAFHVLDECIERYNTIIKPTVQ